MRGDFDRIDEMVRRSCNLRWRHLVSADDVAANHETEIRAMATEQVVEEAKADMDAGLAQILGGAA